MWQLYTGSIYHLSSVSENSIHIVRGWLMPKTEYFNKVVGLQSLDTMPQFNVYCAIELDSNIFEAFFAKWYHGPIWWPQTVRNKWLEVVIYRFFINPTLNSDTNIHTLTNIYAFWKEREFCSNLKPFKMFDTNNEYKLE